MKKIIPMMIGAIALTTSIVPISVAKTFTDVDASHWAYSYIDDLSNGGVINGYADGRFNPSGTITKAEYIKLLVGTVASSKEQGELQAAQDSSANWFDPYVQFATSRGIIKENYSTEEWKSTVSRSEMANLIVEFADYVGLIPTKDKLEVGKTYRIVENDTLNNTKSTDEELRSAYDAPDAIVVDNLGAVMNNLGFVPAEVSTNADASVSVTAESETNNTNAISGSFSDIASLPLEAQEAILYANDLGLVAGYEDGTFKPNKLMSRAEVATIVFRFGESFNKIEEEVWDGPQPTTVE